MAEKKVRQLQKHQQTDSKAVQKKAYRSPVLTEWGTILEMTSGLVMGNIDGGGTGGSTV